jgi:hypothetical protein
VRIAIGLVLLASLAAPLAAQQEIINEKPVRLRHFSGAIVDARGMTVEYALIELRDPKDHHVLASTFADGNGKFAFADRKHGESVELRVSNKGFNTVQYTVFLSEFGAMHWRVKLPVAK